MRIIILTCPAGLAAPASAAVVNQNGEVLITQADALAGGVTAGDTPGYPITISQPGVYRLASGLSVPANQNGIEVTAAEVTIDLSGHRMIGSSTATIGVLGLQRSLTVRNGTIRAFIKEGIRVTGAYLAVDNMRITHTETGVYHESDDVTANVATITDSHLSFNEQGAICGSNCLVKSTTFHMNGFSALDFESANGVVLDSSSIGGNRGFSGSFFFVGDSVISGGSGAPLLGQGFSLSPNRCGTVAC